MLKNVSIYFGIPRNASMNVKKKKKHLAIPGTKRDILSGIDYILSY